MSLFSPSSTSRSHLHPVCQITLHRRLDIQALVRGSGQAPNGIELAIVTLIPPTPIRWWPCCGSTLWRPRRPLWVVHTRTVPGDPEVGVCSGAAAIVRRWPFVEHRIAGCSARQSRLRMLPSTARPSLTEITRPHAGDDPTFVPEVPITNNSILPTTTWNKAAQYWLTTSAAFAGHETGSSR